MCMCLNVCCTCTFIFFISFKQLTYAIESSLSFFFILINFDVVKIKKYCNYELSLSKYTQTRIISMLMIRKRPCVGVFCCLLPNDLDFIERVECHVNVRRGV